MNFFRAILVSKWGSQMGHVKKFLACCFACACSCNIASQCSPLSTVIFAFPLSYSIRIPTAMLGKQTRSVIVTPESETSGFRLFSDSFETLGHTLWGLLGRWPGYSFRTLFGLFWGSGSQELRRPCVGRGQSQFQSENKLDNPHPQH